MPAPVTYQVTAVVPAVQYGSQGQQIAGKTLTFTTSTGYEGAVFIADNVLGDVDRVKAAIEAEVRIVAAAQQIAGTIGEQ
jgi:hypothetical protein